MRKRKSSTLDECPKKNEQGRQDGPSSAVTRFFKIMIGDDFSNVMYLPPVFAQTVMHLAGQETQLEDSCGQRWDVTLKLICGALVFDRGWKEFFSDHNIKEGEFLVFHYIKRSHFVVHIFETTASERIAFDYGNSHLKKRSRIDTETFSSADTHGPDPIANRENSTNAVFNVEMSEPAKLPIIQIEDPVCMMVRDTTDYKAEDRNFLLDLSSFEMERHTETEAVTDFVMINNHVVDFGNNVKLSLTKFEAFNDKFARPSQKIAAPFDADTSLDESERHPTVRIPKAVVKESGKDFSEKIQDPCAPFSQISGPPLKKHKIEEVPLLDQNFVLHSDFYTEKLKKLYAKKELDAEGLNYKSSGQVESMKVVKAEPESGDMSIMALSVVECEVKSLAYLELPMSVVSKRRRDRRCRQEVIQLNDPKGRRWPVLVADLVTVKALTSNWTNFCKCNGIKPGDVCCLQPQLDGAYTVKVTPAGLY